MKKSSRKARVHPKKTASHSTPARWGFDYGVSIRAAALGSSDFSDSLIAAEIIGVAYGISYSSQLRRDIPSISLIGRNETPLRLAFEEFSRWADSSDGDAVDLTFVFMKDGAYKLCVCPETRALIKRALLFDAVMSPLSLQTFWVKHIDSTSKPLKDLRKHLGIGVRPVMFSAASYSGIASRERPPVPELIRGLQHGKEIVKFVVRFVDEGSDIDRHWQQIALGDRTKARSGKRTMPPAASKSSLSKERSARLKTLFPVTLWRSGVSNHIEDVRKIAAQSGLLPWQIDQAICNLTVSREIGAGARHFENVPNGDWPQVLIDHLRSRFEIADGTWIGELEITADAVVEQANLDAIALLEGYGLKSGKRGIQFTLNQLQKAGLLHPHPE